MKRNRKFALLYIVLATVVSVGAAFFQHILEHSYLDRNGLYKSGVLTPEIFVVYAVLSALLILTVVFFLRFDIVPKEMKNGNVNTSIVSVLAAVALVYTAITFFKTDVPFYAQGTSEYMVQRMKLFASVVAFPAALYFMMTAFMGKAKSKITPYLSFFPLLWTLFYVMSLYFDRSTLINNPVKSLCQLALVVLMLYQLYEIRAQIGRAKMVASFVFSLLSTLFLSAAFVPVAVDVAMGTKALTLDNMFVIVCAIMAVYTLSRAIDFAFYSEIDIAKIIEERAREEREKAGITEPAENAEAVGQVEADAGETEAEAVEETEETTEEESVSSEIGSLLASLMAVAEETEPEEAAEETIEEVVEEVAEETTEEVVEEVTEETTEEVVEEAAEETTEEVVEEVAEETTEEVVEEIAEETADEVVEEAAEETADEAVEETAEETTEEDDTLKRLKAFFGDGN